MRRSWIRYGVGATVAAAVFTVGVASVLAIYNSQTKARPAEITPRTAQEDSVIKVKYRMPVTLKGAAARGALLLYEIRGGTHGPLPSSFIPPPLGPAFGLPRSPATNMGCGKAESVYSRDFGGYVDWREKTFFALKVQGKVKKGDVGVERIGGGRAGGWCSGLHTVQVSLMWPRSAGGCSDVLQPYAECMAVRLLARGEFLVGDVRPGEPPNCEQVPSPCRGGGTQRRGGTG